MSTLSKLLNEHIVTVGTNNKLKVTNSGAATSIITLNSGRYRDFTTLASQFDTQLEATIATQTWAVAVSNTNGVVTITSNEAFTVNFDTANYGTTLRDEMGFTVNAVASTANVVTSNTQHTGGYYPQEPVENDNRPGSTGIDRWTSDTFQTEGRTGVLATKGGSVRVFYRSVGFLISQDELSDFSNWMQVCAQGRSFAFYHDATVAWPGADSEYGEYVLNAEGEKALGYDPEPVEGGNNIWHRGKISMRKYVAPGA